MKLCVETCRQVSSLKYPAQALFEYLGKWAESGWQEEGVDMKTRMSQREVEICEIKGVLSELKNARSFELKRQLLL